MSDSTTKEHEEPPHRRRADDECNHWTLDKRVPLALVMAVAVQTGGVIWWGARLTSNQEEIVRRLEALESERSGIRIAERLAVLEHSQSELRAAAARLEGYLARLEDKFEDRLHRNGNGGRNGGPQGTTR